MAFDLSSRRHLDVTISDRLPEQPDGMWARFD
jgi:hypothetical protein